MRLTAEKIEYHRNGVGGMGFHVVLFHDSDGKEGHGRNMVGVVFNSKNQDDPHQTTGYCAVMDRDLLAKGVIGMFEGPGNAWRGDHYEKDLHLVIARDQARRARERRRV